MTPKLKRTLRYCAVLYFFIVPVYYLVFRLWWSDTPAEEALVTSLIYGGCNVLFLGPLHYFFAGKKEDS